MTSAGIVSHTCHSKLADRDPIAAKVLTARHAIERQDQRVVAAGQRAAPSEQQHFDENRVVSCNAQAIRARRDASKTSGARDPTSKGSNFLQKDQQR